MSDAYPSRIVCLTEEPTEVLYALGEERRIVGISGFTVRPPRARKEKPRVSAFISAKFDEILALEPDLAIGFSDLQADIARELVRRGVEVWISNHRSVAGILAYVRRLGALVGAGARAEEYARGLERHVDEVGRAAQRLARRPRVWFEEWDDPLISSIEWVAELSIAGATTSTSSPPRAWPGPHRRRSGRGRPPPSDVIFASWCGRSSSPPRRGAPWLGRARRCDGELHDVRPQPGPAALTDGLDALHSVIARWAAQA